MTPAILIYFFLCVLVAWLGRDRAIGSIGIFVLSLVVTPFISAIILLAATTRES